MRVQPIGRRRTDLAGNDGVVERGQLVEAHERRKFQPGLGGRGDGSQVGAAALNRRDEADDEIGTAVITARDHQSRAALVALEVGERKSSKNDAAEREHSACWLNQVSIGVEIRFLG